MPLDARLLPFGLSGSEHISSELTLISTPVVTKVPSFITALGKHAFGRITIRYEDVGTALGSSPIPTGNLFGSSGRIWALLAVSLAILGIKRCLASLWLKRESSVICDGSLVLDCCVMSFQW